MKSNEKGNLKSSLPPSLLMGRGGDKHAPWRWLLNLGFTCDEALSHVHSEMGPLGKSSVPWLVEGSPWV